MTGPPAVRETSYMAALRADHGQAAVSASGEVVTAWTYKPRDGRRIADGADDNSGLSGQSPVGPAMVAHEIRRHGHVILTAGCRPSRHHVIGDGPGHDDARFCEAGISFAEYCESGRAFGGPWWAWDIAKLGGWFEVLTTSERSHWACCQAQACVRCTGIEDAVMQLIPLPVVQCHMCGRTGRDLIEMDGGRYHQCGACRAAEVFGG